MPKPQAATVDPDQLPALAAAVIKQAKFPMLATMDGDQPRLRPVSPVRVDGFTIYIANLRSYQKTAQIAANPKVELCYMDGEHNQVRITGLAEVLEDRPLLEDIWQKNRLLEHYLGSIDNPQLIVYKVVPNRVTYMQEWALDYWEVPLP
ncbi:MAG: pyridoxamine 5'-phosphate oxidase family protein [Saprospiraceae bacterium]|nr:pyridoxamine 5'-phosphate oxidase family protein [Saprospiraceae bacterium]